MDRYFDDKLNHEVFAKLSKKCYNPAFATLLEMIYSTEKSEKPFKLSICLSGIFVELATRYKPDLIELLRKLFATKHVEVLGGNYYHSLASIYPGDMTEFVEQVRQHHELMKKLFGMEPSVFEDSELLYNNSMAKALEKVGYEGIVTEGVDDILEWKSPNYVYSSPGDKGIKLLFRHDRLSNDIRLRFSKSTWNEFPLTPEKYCNWLAATPGDVISIAFEIDTFGEYNSEDTRIFEFLKQLPTEIARRDNSIWSTPTEIVRNIRPIGTIIVPDVRTISWADRKDTSPWLENSMQKISFDRVLSLQPYIKEINDSGITKIWRIFQQSDHLLYMSNREGLESTQPYHSHYSSPAEAFAVFNVAYTDFEGKVATLVQRIRKSKIQQTSTYFSPTAKHG